jgi:hypothetical protein
MRDKSKSNGTPHNADAAREANSNRADVPLERRGGYTPASGEVRPKAPVTATGESGSAAPPQQPKSGG